MHHFRMKSFCLIPCNKKDVSKFWCCCYHFTDLFIWSCFYSRGKRRSSSRSFLENHKFYWYILVIFFPQTHFSPNILKLLKIFTSRYDCMSMSSSESGGEPKLVCFPKLQSQIKITITNHNPYIRLIWYQWDDWKNNKVKSNGTQTNIVFS